MNPSLGASKPIDKLDRPLKLIRANQRQNHPVKEVGFTSTRTIFAIIVGTLAVCTPFLSLSKSDRRAGSVVVMINPQIVSLGQKVLQGIRDLPIHMALLHLQYCDLFPSNYRRYSGTLCAILGRSMINLLRTLEADTTWRRGKRHFPFMVSH